MDDQLQAEIRVRHRSARQEARQHLDEDQLTAVRENDRDCRRKVRFEQSLNDVAEEVDWNGAESERSDNGGEGPCHGFQSRGNVFSNDWYIDDLVANGIELQPPPIEDFMWLIEDAVDAGPLVGVAADEDDEIFAMTQEEAGSREGFVGSDFGLPDTIVKDSEFEDDLEVDSAAIDVDQETMSEEFELLHMAKMFYQELDDLKYQYGGSCGVCGMVKFCPDVNESFRHDSPILSKLDGIILDTFKDVEHIPVCKSCVLDLKAKKVPKMSMRNMGAIPTKLPACLTGLNHAEILCLSLNSDHSPTKAKLSHLILLVLL